jgi:hypothetical protein
MKVRNDEHCFWSRYYYSAQIKDIEIDGACIMYGKDEGDCVLRSELHKLSSEINYYWS